MRLADSYTKEEAMTAQSNSKRCMGIMAPRALKSQKNIMRIAKLDEPTRPHEAGFYKAICGPRLM